MAVTQYFLGGNTVRGFVSFYSGFCRGPEDFLWVIKGGPGCGKSSFMKTIGRAAEEKGLDVAYVLCSGDPESVDGVYFPALHTGYADGTAPHVLEAVTPGAAGLYLDLSRFYDRLALQPERRTIEQLQRRYQSLYREAYAKLAALAPAACRLPDADGAQRRFLRAVTCRGLFQSAPPAGAVQLVSAAELEALRARPGAVWYQNPLFPDETEAVWLPGEARYYRGPDTRSFRTFFPCSRRPRRCMTSWRPSIIRTWTSPASTRWRTRTRCSCWGERSLRSFKENSVVSAGKM